MPATGADDRHARVHQRQRRAAHRRHRARTVRFQNVADHAHRVGEGRVIRNHRRNGAFRQRPVSDFTPPRAAHEAHFAHAERREIVVQHEALRRFRSVQQLNPLLVVLRAERRRHQRLRLAAREQRRTVRARQHAHFALDLADLVELAAIRTPLRLQHLIAEDAFLQRVEQLLAFRLLLFRQRLDGLLLGRVDARVAFQLLVLLRVHRVLQLRPEPKPQSDRTAPC